MPRIKYAEAPASRISVWVSCRDHDFPIVEICKGEQGAYEAHLKLNLFDFSVVEVEGFSLIDGDVLKELKHRASRDKIGSSHLTR